MKKLFYIFILCGFFIACSKKGELYDFPKLLKIDSTYENIILVDFNGYDLKSDFWNNGNEILLPASGLKPIEEKLILGRIKEAFDTFKVSITTDENVYLKADPFKRMRVVFTTGKWYNGENGKVPGVSYLNSFNWGDDTPCFVFTDVIEVINAGEVGLHELGHTFNLLHQSVYNDKCEKVNEYREGAIMGNPYSLHEGKWEIGQNSKGCNYIQDDKQIIGSILSFKQ